MFSSILTGCINGVEGQIIRAEVDVSTGLPGFSLVGSLSGEVREARERVQVALRNGGYHIPPNKITVNLSPADIRKEGTGFDVPIAVGLLQSMGYFDEKFNPIKENCRSIKRMLIATLNTSRKNI